MGLLNKIGLGIAASVLTLVSSCTSPDEKYPILGLKDNAIVRPYFGLGQIEVSQPIKKVKNVPIEWRRHEGSSPDLRAPILCDFGLLKAGISSRLNDRIRLNAFANTGLNISYGGFFNGGEGNSPRKVLAYDPLVPIGTNLELEYNFSGKNSIIFGCGFEEHYLTANKLVGSASRGDISRDKTRIANVRSTTIYLGYAYKEGDRGEFIKPFMGLGYMFSNIHNNWDGIVEIKENKVPLVFIAGFELSL